MHRVLAIILGGGRGTRLYPLTKLRAKPAVPIAGKYRLIDIPVSNCINSSIHKIYVLTQFNSASLNRHISQTYQFSPLSEGFVEILAAQQTPEHSSWFQGTADAVRHYLPTISEQKAEEILVLSGDHLYRMDFRPFIEFHRRQQADLTISVIPVSEERASEFGILRIDGRGDVVEFREKPRGDALREMQIRPSAGGPDHPLLKDRPFIGSMGIYVFKKQALIKLLLEKSSMADFSKEIIPSAVGSLALKAKIFEGYWEDIGTIESFYRANMGLVMRPRPSFDFFDPRAPIYTRPRFLPPSLVHDSRIDNSMICDGCVIPGADIQGSILGIRSILSPTIRIEHSLIMGADSFQTQEERAEDDRQGLPHIGIGEGTLIRKALIDKNARIGRRVQIINRDHLTEVAREEQGYWISGGIVIVGKGAVIPDHTVI